MVIALEIKRRVVMRWEEGSQFRPEDDGGGGGGGGASPGNQLSPWLCHGVTTP